MFLCFRVYVELKFIEELLVQCAKAKTKQQRKEDTRKIIYIFRELLKKQREQPKIIYTKKQQHQNCQVNSRKINIDKVNDFQTEQKKL